MSMSLSNVVEALPFRRHRIMCFSCKQDFVLVSWRKAVPTGKVRTQWSRDLRVQGKVRVAGAEAGALPANGRKTYLGKPLGSLSFGSVPIMILIEIGDPFVCQWRAELGDGSEKPG